MRCSNCRLENPDGLKFCNECGAPFKRRCAKCGFENVPTAKFCGECAATLTTLTAHSASFETSAPIVRVGANPESLAESFLEGERKIITALFTDIKGSMDLMEDLDPEQARRLVDPALELMIEAVHRYNGYVVQSTGDGIFAIFGAPLAHEDHPQRALYSAVRIQEGLARYSHRLRADGRMPLQARVGVNSGEVVVRSIRTGEAHTEYTPIGHAISLAARMEALAPIGSIAVAGAVRQLCEGYFKFKALGPTRVKGVSEPIEIYEVTGLGPLRTRFQAAARRGLSRFVGRDAELAQMTRSLELVRNGHGQIVAAFGDPGVGKSRLFYEFKAIAQHGLLTLEAYSVSHGKASAYLPVLELLRDYFRIATEDDQRLRREKVAGKIMILDRGLEDTLSYLYALLGIAEGEDSMAQMDTQVRRRRTQEALKRVLLRESLNQPIIVIFEDLHWIDAETEEFLNLLADSIANAPVLLLVNYRPEYHHQWGNKSCYTQLRLDPLPQQNADDMLTALIGDQSELAPLRRVIAERSQGNPFFIEEIVQSLFDNGTLVRNGAVRLALPLSQVHVPQSVHAVLAARIDQLGAEEKELLQAIAVIGREFSMEVACRVAERVEGEVEGVLRQLQLADFIYEQPTVSGSEFIFKHALTREVAYNSLLADRRKLIHAQTADAIETLYEDSLEDHLSELAHHYSRSANAPKAVDYLRRAGQQAIQRSAHSSAMTYLSAGLELLAALPAGSVRDRQELELQMAVGAANSVAAGYGSLTATHAFERALELCARDQSEPELFEVRSGLLLNYLSQKPAKARELGERLVTIAEHTRDSNRLATAYMLLGNVLVWLGEFEFALEIFGRCLAAPEPHYISSTLFGDSKTISHGLSGWALWFLGYPDRALTSVRAAVERARNIRSPLALGWALNSLAHVYYRRGEAESARDAAAEQMIICDHHGFSFQSTVAAIWRGCARVRLGDLDGIEDIERSLSTYADIGRAPTNVVIGAAASAYVETGRHQEALALLTESTIRASDPMALAELSFIEGEVHSDGGDIGNAEACFRKALEVARNQNAKSWELKAATLLAQLLAKQNKQDEARTTLGSVYSWFSEGFDTADLKEAKKLLEELGET
jgi:class 3 adenylate cyclase/tetratricopeptide (TPR) repeat protein